MIHYRKILELRAEGISLRGIATSTNHSRQKVTEIIDLAEKKELVCPLDEIMTDVWIEEFLYPEKTLEASGRQPLDFDYIHQELAKPNVTLSLLHHEYEATLSMDLQSWIRVHNHAYAYFGGTTQIIVPDNLKASVTKHTSQALILNPTYREMAEHYNTVVMPARVRAPKDKSSVEGSVSTVSTWIIAALRNTQCFSIDELNEAIEQKLADFNQRAFTRKQGNRLSAFETEEKFALSPLPATPYKLSVWRTAKVRPDYHVSVESMFYSVPYEYINRQVDIRLSETLVEVYFNHMRVASHKRLYRKFGQLSTMRDHMPDNHKLFVDQTPEAAIEWANSIGSYTLKSIEYILDTAQIEKQALQSIFSLKKSERKYTKYEIERACKMVISITQRPTVKSIQTLLKNKKKNDAEQTLKQNTEMTENNYGFTRGASYYGGKDK